MEDGGISVMADPAQLAARIGSRLARARRHVARQIEADLRAAGLPQLAWCEILFDLARRPDGRAAPGAIERRLVIEQYNLSRLLDRLESKKLVRRVPHPTDRRRQIIEITEEGRRVREAAWPVYSASLARQTAPLSDKQADRLADLLSRLLPAKEPKPAARRRDS
jgi:DNA-binding MarR family transcriptional regulator